MDRDPTSSVSHERGERDSAIIHRAPAQRHTAPQDRDRYAVRDISPVPDPPPRLTRLLSGTTVNPFADSLWIALRLVANADSELLRIVALSLRVSITACAIGGAIGVLLGTWLAATKVAFRPAAVWAVNTLLALPSVVVGLIVYLLLSRTGPLGSLGILFTPNAMIAAQALLVIPLFAALSRRLLLDGLREGGDQLRSMGAGRLQSALLMLAHERFGMLTILLTAFGRAVSEVGAVMIVGGNIEGFTRVMTTAIALETSKGDLPLALALGVVLLGVVGCANLLIGWMQSRTAIAREAFA